MQRFLILTSVLIALIFSGCLDVTDTSMFKPQVNVTPPMANKWAMTEVTEERITYQGPLPYCTPSTYPSAEALLNQWVWFEDGTTFIILTVRDDKQGVMCDEWEWDVLNFARDTYKVPLIAEFHDAEYLAEVSRVENVCHVMREGATGIRLIRSENNFVWVDAPLAIEYPIRNYLITNPLMESIQWQNGEATAQVQQGPYIDAFGFGASFKMHVDGEWQFVDDRIVMMWSRSGYDYIHEETSSRQVTLHYEDKPFKYFDWIFMRTYTPAQ